jgi:tripartite-type tricarboxylate transporter receptor subunit TctC
MNARTGFSFAVVALSLAAVPLAPAQDRIDKPVRIVVGFAAGGTADVMARVVADKLKDSVGQPVIVDNRPGAIGRIAAEAVKNAAPDGATIMVMPIGPMAVVPHVYSDITYDPVKDFTAVALGSTFQFAIAAGPASGAKNWSEFAAWVKANPGKAAYATSGAGSLPHFFGVLISRELGVAMVHVPYKGSAAYVGDLVSGQVPAAVDAIADLTELHRAGRIRILELRRRALHRGARGTYVQRAGPERRRGEWLVRILRARQDAQVDRRPAEPRHQQGAAITGCRREAHQARLGSGDGDAGGIRAYRCVRLRQMGADREGLGIQTGVARVAWVER